MTAISGSYQTTYDQIVICGINNNDTTLFMTGEYNGHSYPHIYYEYNIDKIEHKVSEEIFNQIMKNKLKSIELNIHVKPIGLTLKYGTKIKFICGKLNITKVIFNVDDDWKTIDFDDIIFDIGFDRYLNINDDEKIKHYNSIKKYSIYTDGYGWHSDDEFNTDEENESNNYKKHEYNNGEENEYYDNKRKCKCNDEDDYECYNCGNKKDYDIDDEVTCSCKDYCTDPYSKDDPYSGQDGVYEKFNYHHLYNSCNNFYNNHLQLNIKINTHEIILCITNIDELNDVINKTECLANLYLSYKNGLPQDIQNKIVDQCELKLYKKKERSTIYNRYYKDLLPTLQITVSNHQIQFNWNDQNVYGHEKWQEVSPLNEDILKSLFDLHNYLKDQLSIPFRDEEYRILYNIPTAEKLKEKYEKGEKYRKRKNEMRRGP
jgi:hypothetical protein